MNSPTLLAERLDTTRRALLLTNRIGVRTTKEIIDSGLSALSSNVAITVLTHLASQGPTRPRDLLHPTRLTRGGLSNLFDRLESHGLITRTHGAVPSDRRSAMVVITPAGTAAVSALEDVVSRSLDALSRDLAELADALEQITPDRPTGTTSPRAPVDRLALLSLAGAAMTKALAEVDPNDPTASATVVVLSCAAQPGLTRPNELALHTGLSKSGVSQLLDRLEAEDLIRRRANLPPDRRAVTVELTPRGQAKLEHQLASLADHFALLRSALAEPRP